MKRHVELVCAWGGIVFSVLFGIGFLLIADFIPPLDPNDTAEETATIFREDTNAIRTGVLLAYAGLPFYLAWGASISAQTRRIAGVPRVLVHLQVAAFSGGMLLMAVPFMLWWVAAFRPEKQSAELIQTINDFAWIGMVGGWVPFATLFFTTGVAILLDKSPTPIFPRWSGYLFMLLGTGQLSATFLMYTKSGPLAWNGVLSWWLPAAEFFLFFGVVTVLMVKAINETYRTSVDAQPTTVEAGAARNAAS